MPPKRLSPSTGPRKIPAPEASRDRILDVAIDLFARYGVEGVSLSLLADHVELHKSTLFHHFAGKGELADAALRRAAEPILEIVEGLGRHPRPHLDQLVESALRLDDLFAERPAVARFVLRAMVSPADEPGAHDQEDPDVNPIHGVFTALGSWLERARRSQAIRPVRVRHALIHLLGLSLLYPAIADGVGRDVLPGDPRSPSSRRARRQELAGLLRVAFTPEGDRE